MDENVDDENINDENINDENEKKYGIKAIYLYKESHLPYGGWFQGCLGCTALTTHNIIFKKIKLSKYHSMLINIPFIHWEFYLFLCRHCQKKLDLGKSLCKNTCCEEIKSTLTKKEIKKLKNNYFEIVNKSNMYIDTYYSFLLE